MFAGGRKPSLGTGFGAPLKPGVKMGLYKDDNEIDEDLNNPLFFNKSGFSQRPTDRTDVRLVFIMLPLLLKPGFH